MIDSTREILDYDLDSGTLRTTYSYPSQPPSIAVPIALGALTRTSPTELTPMYEAAGVDPDSLDDLFRPTPGGAERNATVSFDYRGHRVTVKGYGRVVIRTDDADSGERDLGS
ncbi:HalOD1 output domain-containing protein [Halorussus marinus]|uniref:HalOD1 output domain-containing protein n=1 Tax=Halorussus marinus TaxID=2505976 RepID=UPI00106E9D33|nr:HalOD1 output domain-containing protein [Halorussus marinus]